MDCPRIEILIGVPATLERQRRALIQKYIPPPNSRQVLCDRCAQMAWIGPKQFQRKLDQPELEFICACCYIEFLKTATPADDIEIQDCGGVSGSYYLTDGRIILPTAPKEN